MSASLKEISIQISCIRAEKSSVGPWATVWEPDHEGMFPKLLSRTSISREQSEVLIGGKYVSGQITKGNTRFKQSETRFFTI